MRWVAFLAVVTAVVLFMWSLDEPAPVSVPSARRVSLSPRVQLDTPGRAAAAGIPEHTLEPISPPLGVNENDPDSDQAPLADTPDSHDLTATAVDLYPTMVSLDEVRMKLGVSLDLVPTTSEVMHGHIIPILRDKGMKGLAIMLDAEHEDGLITLKNPLPNPARDAGLRDGDVLTLMNGKSFSSYQVFLGALNNVPFGHTLNLQYFRELQTSNTRLTLGRRPGAHGLDIPHTGFVPYPENAGSMLLMSQYRAKEVLWVRHVDVNSIAYHQGFKAGDVIVRLSDDEPKLIHLVLAAVQRRQMVTYIRGGRLMKPSRLGPGR